VLPADRGGRPKAAITIDPGEATGADAARQIVVCVDVSGSMRGAEKLGNVKRGLDGVADRLRPDDRVAVVAFASNVETLVPSTRWGVLDDDRLVAAIENASLGGKTDLYGGLATARDELAATPDDDGAAVRILLLSDGKHNVGSRDRDEFETLAGDIESAGASIMAAGVGDRYDHGLMKALADASRGDWEHIEAPDEIGAFFEREVGRAATLVVPRPELVVDLGPRFEARDVYRRVPQPQSVDADWTHGRTVVPIGDLHGDERQLVTFEVLAPTGQAGVDYRVADVTLRAGSRTLATASIEATYGVDAPSAEDVEPPASLEAFVRGKALEMIADADDPAEFDAAAAELDDLEANSPALPATVFDDLRERLDQARDGDWSPIARAGRDV
jgi:Ca-activated chloride channel family protein